jgi:hypothetical protein
MKYEYAPGATPLDPDEILGLIPLHITTQGQLNEWESANILKAENWIANNFEKHTLLSIGRHARMMTDALLLKNDKPRFSWEILI